jgi:hypothetical protein
VNVSGLGPGHHVICHLPDGRTAIADGGNPEHRLVVAAMRRVHQAGMNAPRERYPGRLQDYAVVSAWLDLYEPLPDGQLFVMREAA